MGQCIGRLSAQTHFPPVTAEGLPPQVYPPPLTAPTVLSTLPVLEFRDTPAPIVHSLVVEMPVPRPVRVGTHPPQSPLRRAATLPRRPDAAATSATGNALEATNQEIIEAVRAWRNGASGRAGDVVDRFQIMLDSNAVSLDLSNLGLSTLPACLGRMRQLEKLDMSNNKLVALPTEIGQLVNLKEIRAQKNNLLRLPESITKLVGLERLLLEDNHLSTIPTSGMDRMVALRELRLNKNHLSVLPDAVAQLPGLLELNVANNKLTRLPNALLFKPEAMLIHCQHNKLEENRLAQYRRMTHDGRTAHSLYVFSELTRFNARSPEPTVADPFGSLNPAKKLQLLLEAASELMSSKDTNCQSIYLGERHLSHKDCLAMALETALVHQPSLISLVSHHLIHSLPDANGHFTLFGTNFKRAQIADWAENRNLPGVVKDDFLESELMTKSAWGSQNVHRSATINFNIRQLQRIRDGAPASKSIAQTVTEINAHLSTLNAPRVAKSGFSKIMDRTGSVEHYNISPAGALAVLWAYVSAMESAPMKVNLLESMQNKFIEIDNNICAVGMLGRIIDIPTAIDWSITSGLSVEQLRTEMMQLASETNEEFEDAYGDQAAFLPAPPTNSARPVEFTAKSLRSNLGRTPKNMADCTSLLLNALRSGHGIFQFVSLRKQLGSQHSEDCKTILELLAEKDRLSENGAFGDEYFIESRDRVVEKTQARRPKHFHTQLVLRNAESGERHVIPITQIGVRYRHSVLPAGHIEQAAAAMEAARKLLNPNGVANPPITKAPLLLSRGAEFSGRAGTLYAYTEIKRAINEREIVDELGLDAALAALKAACNTRNSSKPDILDQQLRELKICLLAPLAKARESDYDADSLELATSNIKRDMFVQKSHVQFVILRGIDADLVAAETNRIFPPGVVI